MKLAPVLPLAPILLACVGCSAETERIGSAGSDLIGGKESSQGDEDFVVTTIFGGEICTGVMLAPTVMATALHCLDRSPGAAFHCTEGGAPLDEDPAGYLYEENRAQPEQVRVLWGHFVPNPDLPSPSARGRALFPALGRVSKCADDLALVVLDGPVGEFRRPLRREGGIEPLEPITVIGFGAPGSGDNYVAVRRHVATIVEDVGTSDEPNQEGVSVGTFETPPVLCDGDAGAPAMAASGAVIGIGASPIGPSVDFTCEEAFHNRFIRLDSHWDLVEQAFAEAGEPLWLESDPGPPWSLEGGQSCDGDSVCASELCLDDGRCAQLCRADRDCSGGELCSLDAGYCVSPDELPFSQTCSLVAGASRRSDAPIWAILALLALGTRRRQAR